MPEQPRPTGAVFLSYASQDAEAARRIADALRAAGIEVWFDQSELVGGDAWDQKIRRQIKDCALLIPIISAATQARTEGYFRLEWRLADQRTHLMAKGRPFLLPVVIDDTRDADAHVPDSFTEVQWTRLPGGETPPAFAARMKNLLGGGSGSRETAPPAPASRELGPPGKKPSRRWLGPALLGAVVVAALALWQPWKSAPAGGVSAVAPAPVSEARGLALRAAALLADPMMVKESVTAAEELCARAVALDPQDGEAWAVYALAATEFIGGYGDRTSLQKENARSRAERAIRLAPASVNAALAMAQFELFVDDNPKASEARLRALIARTPEDKRLAHLLGWALAVQGQVDESLAVLDEAARQPGGDYLALARKGWGLFHAGRWGGAEAAFDASLALQPNREAYHGKLVFLIAAVGDLARTRALLEALPPGQLREDRVAYIGFQAWMKLRQPDKAIEALRRISHDFINEGRIELPVRFGLGEAHQLAGRSQAAATEWAAALATVEQRLKAEPADANLVRWKILLLARLDRSEEAERSFGLWRELKGIKPGETAKMDAKILLALGRLDEAVVVVGAWLTSKDNFSADAASDYLAVRDDPVFDPLRGRPDFVAVLKQGEALRRDFLVKTGLPPPTVGTDAPSATVAAGDKSAPSDKSVAVLAFANLSDDKANEYFSDGISEELLNVLAKVPGLTVRGRSSGFYFKGKQVKSAEIGQQLNVSYLVQGSVRRAGDRVRISAQLIHAATDDVVWSSGSLDRDLKDIFAVQDEIAGLIAKNLSLKMGVAARAPHQVNPEALTALLEGRQFWVLRTTEGFARAGELFKQAIALDPEWAPARAALANLMTIEASYIKGGGESVSERFALAAREAKRAIELDPTLGEPHAALGKIAMEDRRLAEAEEEFRRALALEPNNALVHDWYGDLLVTQGRLDLAIAEYRKAAEIEPLSPYILWDVAWELMHVRRFGEALALIERAATLTPNGSARLSLRRARLLLELGRKTEAEVALKTYLESPRSGSDPQFANEAVWCLNALSSPAERERWTVELLRQYPENFSSGVILLMLGRPEEAFPLLEKTPTIFQQQLYWDPVFDPVRDTPRFQQLLEKLGCAAEYKVARETLARMLQEQAIKR